MTANRIKLIVLVAAVVLLGGGVTTVVLLRQRSTVVDPVASRAGQSPTSHPSASDAAAEYRARETRNRVQCLDNEMALGRALAAYASRHGEQFPPDLATLMRDRTIDPKLFVCPSGPDTSADQLWTDDAAARSAGHLSYVYLGRGLSLTSAQSDEPIVVEMPAYHRGGGNVLFGDLHGEFMSGSDLRSIMQKLLVSPRLNAGEKAALGPQ